ncbi:hypothetical protein SODALDRAFT_330764 [Sodiomyces alkalinus F11]|uniref:S-adenosyl-L-methionine-dependent methyltransferase n=1 Tax=Sodiomyces alkalinus (strain CBS 110278 / VKM F-3762 / F11) TaxID=1314773 RepID=A0A3N2Q2U1_SODAK|nr:hypothetical protein SODALDRAFT_330764 [Sodiomyces alkalinus F11]ROT41046.1 hypothetical protein SODALDRAFT_330764 [Sodiomyces alkalinus F11]
MVNEERRGTAARLSQGDRAAYSITNAPAQAADNRRGRPSRPTRSSRSEQANDESDEEEDDEEDERDEDRDDNDNDFSSVSTDDEPPPIHAYGHTYHGSGRILMPNDESERARLDIQHNLFKACLDGHLTRAPLDPTRPLAILDVGAGSGVWAVEMAQRYPLARIRAVDLSAALLPTAVPPNVVFEIVDAAEPWPPGEGEGEGEGDGEKEARGANDGEGSEGEGEGGESGSGGGSGREGLDFVHVRNLVGGGVRDFRALYAQALRHLRPGGQIEVAEVRPRWFHFEDSANDEEDLDRPLFSFRPEKASSSGREGAGSSDAANAATTATTANAATAAVEAELERLRLEGEEAADDAARACREMEIYIKHFSEQLGVDFDPTPKVRRWLRDVGFEKIVEMSDLVPIRPVGGDEKMRRKGALVAQMMEYGMENYTLALFGKGGLPESRARNLLERIQRGVRNASFQAYVKV